MSENKNKLAFQKENYWLMLAGIALIFVGFVIMYSDSQTFGFGFLGLSLGPVVVFLGFLIQFAAILYQPSGKGKNNQV